jgi:TolB-like protein
MRVGVYELDQRSRELRGGSLCVRLQDQPFAVLSLLLERPGDVVTRGELRRRLWPEGTFVDFEHSLNAAIKRLRAALGDDAAKPTFVETVPRRGYRFIGAIEDHAIDREAVAPRRLAVLPFTSFSDERSLAYFSDGLTEELITQLVALYRGELEIVASSMFFSHSVQRIRDIGDTLQAGYLLEGSARRDGARVRITARLVETATEAHVWSDIYDHVGAETLAMQADVAGRVARAIVRELATANRDEPVADGIFSSDTRSFIPVTAETDAASARLETHSVLGGLACDRSEECG